MPIALVSYDVVVETWLPSEAVIGLMDKARRVAFYLVHGAVEGSHALCDVEGRLFTAFYGNYVVEEKGLPLGRSVDVVIDKEEEVNVVGHDDVVHDVAIFEMLFGLKDYLFYDMSGG